MKQLFTAAIALVCTLSLTAQIDYRITGFAGKDTVNLGTVSLDAKGSGTLSLGTYSGAIRLTPVDSRIADIAQHLQNAKAVNSEQTFNAAKAYINDTLRFDILYHSGFWKEYVQQWVGFYAQSSQSPEKFAEVFIPVAKEVLGRTATGHPDIASALSKDLIEFFEQFNLMQAAENLAVYSLGMNIPYGEHTEIASRLVLAQKLIGKPAPAISGIESPLTKTLVMFYESGCHNCDAQISDLKANYSALNAKGYRIISISSDNDQKVYEYHSKDFPWTDKLCDFKGFDSENFKNFGVASTPNLFVIDTEGKIAGRYPNLSATGLILEGKKK